MKCLVNDSECRLQVSRIYDGYREPLGSIITVTDMTDKIEMISELEMYRNHLQERLDEKTRELEAVTLESIAAVANTIDAKDPYTKGHSVRVSEYSAALATKLGMDEEFVTRIRYMGLLHDIGKIGVPDAVLKKPGRLTDEEFDMMKMHTTIGGEILKDVKMIPGIALGAKHHHEKYDGTGYPEGLKGEEIPIEARIIGICDAFDAMTSTRVYRKKLDLDYVVGELQRCSGTQFDPKMIPAFLELIDDGLFVYEKSEI